MTEFDLILIVFAVTMASVVFAIASAWTVLLKHSTVGPVILFKWDVWFPSRAGKYLTDEGEKRYRKLFRLILLIYAAVFVAVVGVILVMFATAGA